MRVLDLSDPVNPRDVGAYTTQYVHDLYVRNDIAYCATIYRGGFTIVNVADKTNPVESQFVPYAGAVPHNTWLNDDGRYLLTTDETGGGHLRIWDLQTGLFQVAEWSAHPRASIHNVVVRGDSAYASYYTEGLQVVDISDPVRPLGVAFYDTWPGVSDGYNGNWGVYPLLASGNIILSDITSGLFVVRLVAGEPVADFALTAPQPQLGRGGETLFFFFDLHNTSQLPNTFAVTASNSQGWPMTYSGSVQLPGGSSEAIAVFVNVPADVGGPVRVEVEMCAESQATGRSLCAKTGIAVPVLLQAFAARQERSGVVLEWELGVEGAERGDLHLLRAAAETPAAWVERVRLPLVSGRWVDTDVEAGRAYIYSLAVDGGAGRSILGQSTVLVTGPSVSRLLGSEPNPFNPATRIRFDLARPGDVALAVYDARGRLIHKMLQPELGAGRQALVWNGVDGAGRPQPSGVYFYEIQSSGWRARGRMVLSR